MAHLTADRERCIGAGMCVLTAPELFDQDEAEGRVLLRSAAPPPGDEAVALRATQACPSGAITLVRRDG